MRNIWQARAPWRPAILRSGCRRTIADNSEDMEKEEKSNWNRLSRVTLHSH